MRRRSLDQSWGLNLTPNASISPKNNSAKYSRTPPNRLIKLSASGKPFWDRTPVGCMQSINWCNNRTPVVCLNKSVLFNGCRSATSSKNCGSGFRRILQGTVHISECENIMTFSLKSLRECVEPSKIHSIRFAFMECQVPIDFIDESNSASVDYLESSFQAESQSWFDEPIDNHDGSFQRSVLFKASCSFSDSPNGTTCSVKFNISTIPFVFNLLPIRPIVVVPTPLSSGLSDPTGNGFLHGEPKSGFLTIDKNHRLIPVLDSDPKASSLLLVGLWVSGVESSNHPFVWTACTRFLIRSDKHSSPTSLDPFLVLVYKKRSQEPEFLECLLKNSVSRHELLFYSAKTTCRLSQTTNEELNESLVMNFTRVDATSHDKSLSEKETGTITPCQQPQSASSSVDSDRNRTNSDNGDRLSRISDVRVASPILKSVTIRRSGARVKEPQQLTSANRTSTPPLPQLHSRTTESVGTMTSLISHPVTSPCRCAMPEHSENRAEATSEVPGVTLRVSRPSDSLVFNEADLPVLLSGVTQVDECSMLSESDLSSVGAELGDFAESVVSTFRQLNIRSNNHENRNVLGGIKKPFRTLRPVSEYPSQNEDYDREITSFDGFMKTALAVAPTSAEDDSHRQRISTEKSLFNSFLIPHLNYQSLYLSDLDNYQSAELNDIAHKYVKTPNNLHMQL